MSTPPPNLTLTKIAMKLREVAFRISGNRYLSRRSREALRRELFMSVWHAIHEYERKLPPMDGEDDYSTGDGA